MSEDDVIEFVYTDLLLFYDLKGDYEFDREPELIKDLLVRFLNGQDIKNSSKNIVDMTNSDACSVYLDKNKIVDSKKNNINRYFLCSRKLPKLLL